MLFPISILIAFSLAAMAPYLVRRLGAHAKWIMAAGPLLCLIIFAGELTQLEVGQPKVVNWSWVPSLDRPYSKSL